MTNPTETARALLYRHGLPEGVIDGALCLHAQELAALQRLRMEELDLTGQRARLVGRIVDLIDPTKPPASAAPTATDAQHMLARMRADAATHDIGHLLQLLARRAASSEGRDVLLDDLVAAGYRLPHAYGNCESVDLAAPAVPVAGAGQAADQAGLLDIAAQAIRDSNGTPEALAWWTQHPQLVPAHLYAAAVLAVLPEPTDQATVRAALRDAADQVFALDYDEMVSEQDDENLGSMREAWNLGTIHATELLRRLADEQPEAAAEAHPPEHRWAAELYDPTADEWVPGTRFPARERAVAALEHGRRIGATWKDGTPTQRRLVRETKTYTVEPAPAGPAAPAKEA